MVAISLPSSIEIVSILRMHFGLALDLSTGSGKRAHLLWTPRLGQHLEIDELHAPGQGRLAPAGDAKVEVERFHASVVED